MLPRHLTFSHMVGSYGRKRLYRQANLSCPWMKVRDVVIWYGVFSKIYVKSPQTQFSDVNKQTKFAAQRKQKMCRRPLRRFVWRFESGIAYFPFDSDVFRQYQIEKK